MENKNNSGLAAFLKTKGFYAAVVLCIVAAGIASWAAIENTIHQLENQNPAVQNSKGEAAWEDTETAKKQNNVKVQDGLSSSQALSSQGQRPSASVGQSGKQQGAQGLQTASFILPADGEIIAAFSGSELVYNETMADWRTHNGIDIAAATDSAVKAAAAGTVSKIYTDALWGTVVEQTSGKMLLRYTGLNDEVPVKEGDVVAVGQTIGRTGEALAEAALVPHLHFEVLKEGIYQNPAELIG